MDIRNCLDDFHQAYRLVNMISNVIVRFINIQKIVTHTLYEIRTLVCHLHSDRLRLRVGVWLYCKIICLALFYYTHVVNKNGQGGSWNTFNTPPISPLLYHWSLCDIYTYLRTRTIWTRIVSNILSTKIELK